MEREVQIGPKDSNNRPLGWVRGALVLSFLSFLLASPTSSRRGMFAGFPSI